MMKAKNDWPLRWYGWWRESVDDVGTNPSIIEAIDRDWDCPDKDRIVAYLRAAPIAEMRYFRQECIFTERLCVDYFAAVDNDGWNHCVRTDNEFFWSGDLAHYVQHHDVTIPASMVDHIRRSNYLPPSECRISEAEIRMFLSQEAPCSRAQKLRTRVIRFLRAHHRTKLYKLAAGIPFARISRKRFIRIVLDHLAETGWGAGSELEIQCIGEHRLLYSCTVMKRDTVTKRVTEMTRDIDDLLEDFCSVYVRTLDGRVVNSPANPFSGNVRSITD